MSSNLTCPVTGNSDLYGLGIRLGIYIQMLSVQLSNFSSDVLRTRERLGQGIVLLILATSIVLARELAASGSKEDKHIQPVEVFPILTLLFAQVRVCRVPFKGSQTTVLLYILEVAALMALSVWFWWHGMDTLPRACADDKAFFFAKVSIWHWFRKLNKASSIIFAIAGSLAVLLYLSTILSLAVNRFLGFVHKRRVQRQGENRDETSFFDTTAEFQYETTFGTASVDVFLIVFAVVYVEMALKWNNISGVHTLASAGQFMPFFIALAQLTNVLYDMAKRGLSIVTAEDDARLSDLEDSDEHEVECIHVGGGWFKRAQDAPLPLTNLR